jgi:hypothetical protein
MVFGWLYLKDWDLSHVNVRQVGEKSENLKKPDDNNNHDNNVNDCLDFVVHGDVGIDQPKKNAYDY